MYTLNTKFDLFVNKFDLEKNKYLRHLCVTQ